MRTILAPSTIATSFRRDVPRAVWLNPQSGASASRVRVFAPTAQSVVLCRYPAPTAAVLEAVPMRRNGDAIYGTRPWVRAGEAGKAVSYTRKDGSLFVQAVDPSQGEVALHAEVSEGTPVHWLGADGSAPAEVIAATPAGS